VIVVSEETSTISVVMAGEIVSGLDAPRLREALTEILSSDRRELPRSLQVETEAGTPTPAAEARGTGARARTAG
jgi:hypothetical protein